MELVVVIDLLNSILEDKLEFDNTIPKDEMETLFLEKVESLDSDQEARAPQDIFEEYESIVNKRESITEDNLKKEYNMSEESIRNWTDQEKIQYLISVFEFWNKNQLVSIEVPEELTVKIAEKAFVEAVDLMSWEVKMSKGGYTKDIHDYYMFCRTKPVRAKRVSRGEIAKIALEKRAGEIKNAFGMLTLILETKFELVENNKENEALFLETIVGANPEYFKTILANEALANLFQTLLIERKVHLVKSKVRGPKGTKAVKLWDGKDLPFSETTPTGDKSMTFDIWEKIQKGKSSIDGLTKYCEKNYPKASGKARVDRQTVNLLNKMAAKVSNFYNVEIPTTLDGKIIVTKI